MNTINLKSKLSSLQQLVIQKDLDPSVFSKLICKAYDEYICELYRSLEFNNIAIVALGSYGREDISLKSDLDILVLYDDSFEEASRCMNEVIYPLWNGGIEVGGATRAISDCSDIIKKDAKAVSAMLDARLIVGDPVLFNEMEMLLKKHFSDNSNLKVFFDTKLDERKGRLKLLGNTIYLTEPNIKESEGGLRDWHTLHWCIKAYSGLEYNKVAEELFGEKEVKDKLDIALKFISSVRHRLHYIENRKIDRLSIIAQEKIADMLGYKSDENRTASEQFLSNYFKNSGYINTACSMLLEKLGNKIKPAGIISSFFSEKELSEGIIKTASNQISITMNSKENEVDKILKGLNFTKRLGIPFNCDTKYYIYSKHSSFRDTTLSNIDLSKLRALFIDFKNIDLVISELINMNYLSCLIPEYESIMNLIKHDGFHVYTVGKHSTMSLVELSVLVEKGKFQHSDVLLAKSLIKRPHVLIMATLLHDIGKGVKGDHCLEGGRIAKLICSRLGYSENDCDDIGFLVRSHLLLSTLAFRRDISDRHFLQKFVDTVKSAEILAMLYLLTCVDIKSVGPNIWNKWKQSLLSEFFKHSLWIMNSNSSTAKSYEALANKKKRNLIKRCKSELGLHNIKADIERLPEKYMILAHQDSNMNFIKSITKNSVDVVSINSVYLKEKSVLELSLSTIDRCGLFADISYVLTKCRANIVDAALYTTEDGRALDIFWLTDEDGNSFNDPERVTLLEKDLEKVLSTDHHIYDEPIMQGYLEVLRRFRPVKITLDNDISVNETVLEIEADDRIGLLHSIARLLLRLNLNISRARISTYVDRVIDTFYVCNLDGKKVEDEAMKEKIVADLKSGLS